MLSSRFYFNSTKFLSDEWMIEKGFMEKHETTEKPVKGCAKKNDTHTR